MSVTFNQIPRAEKSSIAKAIHSRLSARLRKGPPEPELDDYLPRLLDTANRLDATSDGDSSAETERAKRIAAVVRADDEVDAYLRHIEGYLAAEALRRTGPNGPLARALHDSAFPDGLAHIDEPIVEENLHCRDSLAVLRAPEHMAALDVLGLPLSWLDRFESALDVSDAAIREMRRFLAVQGNPSVEGQATPKRDPEADWDDLMTRLRRYVANRAEHDDIARKEEGRGLLYPLFEVLLRLRMEEDTAKGPRKG